MSSFDQIKESLDRALACAREIADKAVLAFNSVDSFMNDVRNLRRDLPHLIGRIMRTFQGGELLTADLRHELDCVQEDAFQVADWIKRTADEGDELQKSSSAGAASGQLWGEANHRAFLESVRQQGRLKATCDRAHLRATQICTTADKAAAKPEVPSVPIQARDTDNSEDTRKKSKKVGKRGPRNPTEFLKFKAAIERGQKKGVLKKDAALEFTNGDELKAKALLKKLTRHKELPP